MADQLIVSAEAVWFAYSGTDWAVRDAHLSIRAGEYVAIIGPNGAGKTTLAKQLNGLLLPSRGRVLVQGQDTRSLGPHDLAKAVGYVFQNPDHQLFAATTQDEIAFGPSNLGLCSADVDARVADTLSRFDLGHLADTPPAMLSFPLRRQVALASVYAMRPRALILDEPTGGLDRDSTEEVLRAIGELRSDGHCIILITHDMQLVAKQADRVILMKGGSVAADVTPRDAFAGAERLRSARVEPPQIARLAHRLSSACLRSHPLSVEEFVDEYARVLSARAPRGEEAAAC